MKSRIGSYSTGLTRRLTRCLRDEWKVTAFTGEFRPDQGMHHVPWPLQTISQSTNRPMRRYRLRIGEPHGVATVIRNRCVLTGSTVMNAEDGKGVWDVIWNTDKYAAHSQRLSRASRRMEILGLDKARASDLCRLDLGCGSCENLSLLAFSNPKSFLIGGDVSFQALRRSRCLASNTHRISLDAARLPFADRVFDIIYAFGLLEHIRDVERAIAEVSRVLKPESRLYLTTSNAKSCLQVKNAALACFGLYPYGYQWNMNTHDVETLLRNRFRIVDLFVVHADWDMPVVRLIDSTLSMFVGGIGRYIYCICEKLGDP